MKLATVLFPYCAKVLPTVYSNTLSYYEEICRIAKCVEEVIDVLNGWEETINELEQAIVDLDEIKSTVNRLDSGLTELTAYVNDINNYAKSLEGRIKNNEDAIASLIDTMAGFNTSVDEKLDALERKLTRMINSVTADIDKELSLLQAKINQIRVNLQSQINDLRDRVDEIDTSVINPWHDNLGRITQDANIKLVYSDLADEVPTAGEYARLGLTANEYSDLDITAMDYTRRGKERLHFYWVFSPTYGFKQEISNVLTSIVNFISKTLSANEYTALDLTADEYSALDLTASDYYSYNPSVTRGYVSVDPTNIGLSVEQYSHLGVVE